MYYSLAHQLYKKNVLYYYSLIKYFIIVVIIQFLINVRKVSTTNLFNYVSSMAASLDEVLLKVRSLRDAQREHEESGMCFHVDSESNRR